MTLLCRLLAAALLAVLLAGCTGGDNDNEDQASPPSGDDQPVTTAARQITGGPFCEFALTFNDRFGRVGATATDAQALRRTFEDATSAIEQAESTAPPEIRADVRVLATAFRDLLTVLRQANFDPIAVPPASFQRLDNPEIQASGQRLDNYVRENCRSG